MRLVVVWAILLDRHLRLYQGKEWIRLPSIIYAVCMIDGVIMILSEEAFGQYHTSHLALVIFANASWIIFPLIILFRLGLNEHPFARPVASVHVSEMGV